MQSTNDFWFPAKRYGWGWGLPTAWQGWVVMAGFVALLGAGAFLFPPTQQKVEFLGCVAALCVGLVAICYWKGEPPKWRWGSR